MNHYYGEGKWNGNYYNIGNRFIDPRESMKSTLGYIYGNTALTNDRMGKTQDYLAMESQRLDRTLGGYDNITYRDLLDYFSKDGNNQYIYGKYYNFLRDPNDNSYIYNEAYHESGLFGYIMASYFDKENKWDNANVDYQVSSFENKIQQNGKLDEFNKDVKKYIESYIIK